MQEKTSHLQLLGQGTYGLRISSSHKLQNFKAWTKKIRFENSNKG